MVTLTRARRPRTLSTVEQLALKKALVLGLHILFGSEHKRGRKHIICQRHYACVMGVYRPDTGELYIDGRIVECGLIEAVEHAGERLQQMRLDHRKLEKQEA